MTTDESLGKFRQVTKILADLDLLFCVTKRDPQAPDLVWVLNPINDLERPNDPELAVTIQLEFHDSWLNIASTIPFDDAQLDADALLRLLKVNVPLAKIVMAQPPPTLLASAQVAEARIDPSSLKDALGLVLVAARLARAALRPPRTTRAAH